jgi:hypothetical protein
MNAQEVKEALHRRHGCNGGSGEWVCIDEAFSGYSTASGGIDTLALGVWRSAKAPGLENLSQISNAIVAYEVKVSRSDFRRELYGYQPGAKASYRTKHVLPWPGKAYWALEQSNYFVFAVPVGLLKPEEIERREPGEKKELYVPAETGLVEVDDRGCFVRVKAPLTLTNERPFLKHQTAELIRHATDPAKLRDLRILLRQAEENYFSYMEVSAAVDSVMQERGSGGNEALQIANEVMGKLRAR